MNILVVNAGSSTVKCALFDFRNSSKEPIWKGNLDWGKGKEFSIFSYETNKNRGEKKSFNMSSLDQSIKDLLKTTWEGPHKVISGQRDIHLAGHRVVHGGEQFVLPTLITPEVKTKIHSLERLAPLHNPSNLKGIEVLEALLPDIPQYAVFDTAFHSTISEIASLYPLPLKWKNEGIRKYGFHGISHQYCSERAQEMLKGQIEKMIICHLGNGASLSAVENGRCVDTTMGFTPLDGLMMGTRSGSIDPGIIIQWMREKNFSAKELEEILYRKSGLLGICGLSDMRTILDELDKGNEIAQLAFDMYIYRLNAFIGSMAAALNGVNCLVFTAGIGENSSKVREASCKNLSYLGASIGKRLNENCIPDQDISGRNSKVRVLVIHTCEEYAIAQAVSGLNGQNGLNGLNGQK